MSALAWVAVVALVGHGLNGQAPEPDTLAPPASGMFAAPFATSPVSAPDPDRWVGFRSLVLPGWGQRSQGRSFWWVFPMVEAAAWGGWMQGRSAGDRFRGRYRDLAWNRARQPLWKGARQDGPWEYYERMIRWEASGAFDREPGEPRLVPEVDPSTFNGSIWALAQALHLGGNADADPDHPSYQRALDYYRERAIPPELAWDWGGDDEGRERFRVLVRESDEAFRRATGFVGLVLVNHFVAAVEAWVTEHPGPLAHVPFHVRGRALPGHQPGEWMVRIDLRARTPGGMR